ncbi:hypothetical protein KCU85_g253, partial [Aureobasidium melanogenum]
MSSEHSCLSSKSWILPIAPASPSLLKWFHVLIFSSIVPVAMKRQIFWKVQLTAFALQQTLDVRRLQEVVVEVLLKRCHVAEDNMLVLDRQVLAQDIVGATDDEFVDQGQELTESLITLLTVGIGTTCIATTQDRKLELLAELHSCTKLVTFITEKKANWRVLELVNVESERVVRHNNDRTNNGTT